MLMFVSGPERKDLTSIIDRAALLEYSMTSQGWAL